MVRVQEVLKRIGIVLFPVLALHCNSTDSGSNPATSPIKVLQPKAGAQVKATDTLKIITESDYTRIAGNLSAIFSLDSGKNWDLILSAAHHDALARDTFPFLPKDFGIAAGQNVKLQIKEYGTGGLIEEIGFIQVD